MFLEDTKIEICNFPFVSMRRVTLKSRGPASFNSSAEVRKWHHQILADWGFFTRPTPNLGYLTSVSSLDLDVQLLQTHSSVEILHQLFCSYFVKYFLNVSFREIYGTSSCSTWDSPPRAGAASLNKHLCTWSDTQ